jgi:hypothetical protein
MRSSMRAFGYGLIKPRPSSRRAEGLDAVLNLLVRVTVADRKRDPGEAQASTRSK